MPAGLWFSPTRSTIAPATPSNSGSVAPASRPDAGPCRRSRLSAPAGLQGVESPHHEHGQRGAEPNPMLPVSAVAFQLSTLSPQPMNGMMR